MTTISSGDFLRTKAVTPLNGRFLAAGMHLSIATNFEPVLSAARDAFEEAHPGCEGVEDIRLRCWVEDASPASSENTKPYFRGLDHLIFCGFDSCNSFLLNVKDGCGIGRFTSQVASDSNFWGALAFPVLLTVLGTSAGLASLHCACIAWKGSGLLLAGESGAGKSTLSLALAQSGFDFLSDDRTLVGAHQGRLLAWGLSREMKQRAESVAQFPFLSQIEPSGVYQRADELRFDAGKISGIHHIRCCEPRWLVFLERQSRPAFSLTAIPPHDAALRLESQLLRASAEAQEKQRRVVEHLANRECYRLQYCGDPRTVAGALHSLVVNGWKAEKQPADAPTRKTSRSTGTSDDPLRRFRATPLNYEACLMGRHIRVETNSPTILKNAETVFNCMEGANNTPSQFLWRIVTEPGRETGPAWPQMTAFSDNDLRYINLGKQSFIAVDLRSRQGVGVIPESLASDEAGFSSVFLASMLHLSAPALGLVPISAACIGIEGRGLLLFGGPGSGKTTASYRSTKLGLEFHADQGVFLETKSRRLHAWGQFWPAAFRPDAAQLFPELLPHARSFDYCGETFLCVGKNSLGPFATQRIAPVCCVFLERRAGVSPRLIPLHHDEVSGRIPGFLPFRADPSFGPGRDDVLQALGRLTAYHLTYGDDSSDAAVFLRSILSTHQPTEEPF